MSLRFGSRTLTAVAVTALSLAVSVALAVYLDVLFLFLVVPFVPLLFRGDDESGVRECPVCGFRTRDDDYDYCPRDGEELRPLYHD
ncbi:MAG: hypothetical protein ACLFSW_01020 [Halobacteriales archaeon]